MYLGRQLAGRRQDQYTRAFASAGVFRQALQQWQGEPCGFTGTRLGSRHHVPAG